MKLNERAGWFRQSHVLHLASIVACITCRANPTYGFSLSRWRPFVMLSDKVPKSPNGAFWTALMGTVSFELSGTGANDPFGDNGDGDRNCLQKADETRSNHKANQEAHSSLFSDRVPKRSSNVQSNPTNIKKKLSDLYDSAELEDICNIHQNLILPEIGAGAEPYQSSSVNSNLERTMHDIVTDAIAKGPADCDDERLSSKLSNTRNNNVAEIDILSELVKKGRNVTIIASDVDGTLLSSNQNIHPQTLKAIQRATDLVSSKSISRSKQAALKMFFIATGKTRHGALTSLGPKVQMMLHRIKAPGAFLQGLYCTDADGTVIVEWKLQRDAIIAAENLVKTHGVSVVGCDGDDLWTTKVTPVVRALNEFYGEPMPKLLPVTNSNVDTDGEIALADHQAGLHKLLILDYDVEHLTRVVRPKLEELANQYNCVVTQAVSTMIELLPQGASKGRGVRALCERLGAVPETELLALGDAENDSEMLSMAYIGVAMGNARIHAKRAADFVMKKTSDDGGAGDALELLVLNNFD